MFQTCSINVTFPRQSSRPHPSHWLAANLTLSHKCKFASWTILIFVQQRPQHASFTPWISPWKCANLRCTSNLCPPQFERRMGRFHFIFFFFLLVGLHRGGHPLPLVPVVEPWHRSLLGRMLVEVLDSDHIHVSTRALQHTCIKSVQHTKIIFKIWANFKNKLNSFNFVWMYYFFLLIQLCEKCNAQIA